MAKNGEVKKITLRISNETAEKLEFIQKELEKLLEKEVENGVIHKKETRKITMTKVIETAIQSYKPKINDLYIQKKLEIKGMK